MPKSVFYKISRDRKLKLLKPAIKEFVSSKSEGMSLNRYSNPQT